METRLRASDISALLGIEPERITISTLLTMTGGNNRVFKVEAKDRKYFAKIYYRDPLRDRLNSELSFLSYAKGIGLTCIPDMVSFNKEALIGLFEFVEGRQLTQADVTSDHIQQAACFIRQLNSASDRTRLLQQASDGSFSFEGHISFLEKRLNHLYDMPVKSSLDREARVLVGKIAEQWEETKRKILTGDELIDRELSLDDRCISPSDFGFHNMLLKTSGDICFVDFEYAGWDDPAKMVGDFFLHPAIPVSLEYFDDFVLEALGYSANVEGLINRSRILLPLCWIKWCCLQLNDFLPEVAERHQFANPDLNAKYRKEVQLERTQEYFKDLRRGSTILE